MRVGSVASHLGPTAVIVRGADVLPVRSLPGRAGATDASALIAEPLAPAEWDLLDDVPPLEPTEFRWLPPLRPPKNVFCVGKNYLAHVLEGARAEGKEDASAPASPIWFTKAHTALVGHNEAILLHPRRTHRVDYEGELAVVIGRPVQPGHRGDPLQSVFGYTVFNDVTARDVQQDRGQWFLGKSADTFGPIGPWITTKDDVPDAQGLEISSSVNGETRQTGNTSQMIFPIDRLIEDLSTYVSLEPGDVIATGTPAGVAWGKEDSQYLQQGDIVTVTVERVGTLSNVVQKGVWS